MGTPPECHVIKMGEHPDMPRHHTGVSINSTSVLFPVILFPVPTPQHLMEEPVPIEDDLPFEVPVSTAEICPWTPAEAVSKMASEFPLLAFQIQNAPAGITSLLQLHVFKQIFSKHLPKYKFPSYAYKIPRNLYSPGGHNYKLPRHLSERHKTWRLNIRWIANHLAECETAPPSHVFPLITPVWHLLRANQHAKQYCIPVDTEWQHALMRRHHVYGRRQMCHDRHCPCWRYIQPATHEWIFSRQVVREVRRKHHELLKANALAEKLAASHQKMAERVQEAEKKARKYGAMRDPAITLPPSKKQKRICFHFNATPGAACAICVANALEHQ